MQYLEFKNKIAILLFLIIFLIVPISTTFSSIQGTALAWDKTNLVWRVIQMTSEGMIIASSSMSIGAAPDFQSMSKPNGALAGYYQAGDKFVPLLCDSSGNLLVSTGAGPIPSAFLGLTDTPASYAGATGEIAMVNATADAIEFSDAFVKSVNTQTGEVVLTSDDITEGSINLYNVQSDWDEALSTEASFINNKPTLVTAFTGLSDVPSSYSGQANKVVTVNVAEDALEFSEIAPAPVDSVNGDTGAVVLDSDDIAEGSTNLYNVQADWDEATSTDPSYINNKPPIIIKDTGNTALGLSALDSLTSGNYNNAIGYGALTALTSGYNNSAIGYYALDSLTTGYSNTGFGYNSLGASITGYRNTAVGNKSLQGLTNNGNNNTAIGYNAAVSMNHGSKNVMIGADSSCSYGADNSIMIGFGSHVSAEGVTNEIAIGYSTWGNGTNTVTIGNSDITDNYLNGSIHQTAVTSEIVSADSTGKMIATSGTEGDILYYNGSAWTKLPIGTDGKVLSSNGSTVEWADAPSPTSNELSVNMREIVEITPGGFDIPSETPLAPLDFDDGTNKRIYFHAFDNTTSEYVMTQFTLKDGYVAGNTFYFEVDGFSSTATGGVAFDIALGHFSPTVGWDGTWSTPVSITDTSLVTAGDLNRVTGSAASSASYAAGDTIMVLLSRDVADASDDMAADFNLTSFQIGYNRLTTTTTDGLALNGDIIFNKDALDADVTINKATTGVAYNYDGGTDTHTYSGTVDFSGATVNGISSYDFVIDAAGNGNYTSIETALETAGNDNKSFFIKNGTYNETGIISMKQGQTVIGESAGGVIIDFGETSSYISIIGTKYETGTVSLSGSSTEVIGSGTTFVSGMVGGDIFVNNMFLGKIESFTDTTHLNISNDSPATFSNDGYSIVYGMNDITIKNITLQNNGAGSTLMRLSAVNSFIGDNIILSGNGTGDDFTFLNCLNCSLNNFDGYSSKLVVSYSTHINVTFNTCTSIQIDNSFRVNITGNVINTIGYGIYLSAWSQELNINVNKILLMNSSGAEGIHVSGGLNKYSTISVNEIAGSYKYGLYANAHASGISTNLIFNIGKSIDAATTDIHIENTIGTASMANIFINGGTLGDIVVNGACTNTVIGSCLYDSLSATTAPVLNNGYEY